MLSFCFVFGSWPVRLYNSWEFLHHTMTESGCSKPVSVRSTRTESLPFSSIPAQSELFIRYQEDPVSLRRFYPSAVGSYIEIAELAGEVLDHYSTDRDLLCDALSRTNTDLKAGPPVFENIDRLRQSNTVAVLTGQQTGLFTGPLYSIYKALSAVRMAECLTARGVEAVPVFWMATEDHDLNEVSNVFAIDGSGHLFESRLAFGPDAAGQSVGRVAFDESMAAAVDDLFASLPDTEFSSDLRHELSASWRPGGTFGNGFGEFLTRLLGRFGLIVVDPLDQAIKRLAAPMYVEAIRKSRGVAQALNARSEELVEAGFHAQVLVEEDYFPLFRHANDGRRLAMRLGDGVIRVKGERESFGDEELAREAEIDPARFSPGVMLRPVVQDFLFPTICYFGGGAEIAYFAQNSEVYRLLERPVTPILHRQSFTVVEPKHRRTLEKYGLSLANLFAGEASVATRIIDRFIDPETAKLFAESEEKINMELHRLDEALSRMDVTLAANLATRRRKILYHIAAMRKKYHGRRAETDETINRRLKSAFETLLPHGHLQERTLNVVSFLDRFGPAFIDWIYESIDLEDKGHRIVYL